MRRVIVCGGRNYTKTDVVFGVLDRVARGGEFMLINGGASGADQRAREWAVARGAPCATVPAQWDRLGKSAGPVRNTWMLALKPDMVIAFAGGRGTEDMTLKALHAGVPTFAATDARELIPMAFWTMMGGRAARSDETQRRHCMWRFICWTSWCRAGRRCCLCKHKQEAGRDRS